MGARVMLGVRLQSPLTNRVHVNRILLLTILPALLLVSGCKSLMNVSSSSFLANFSLEELVKKNRSAFGMICANGGLGGSDSGVSSRSLQQSSSNKSASFSCQIGAQSFDEAAFAASLRAEVEEEIIRSGARIMNQGTLDPAGFYFEYREGKIHGRINIEGKKSGGTYYSLKASLDEKSEMENQ